MTAVTRKLVLVYPPYVTVTSPPLGVCSLKGFVQRKLPEWSVQVLDLNRLFYDELFDGLDRQVVAPAPNAVDRMVNETLLTRAGETFSGRHEE